MERSECPVAVADVSFRLRSAVTLGKRLGYRTTRINAYVLPCTYIFYPVVNTHHRTLIYLAAGRGNVRHIGTGAIIDRLRGGTE
jgi:hypothetical protein